MLGLYNLLDDYYGSKSVWTEVEQVFEEEGLRINMEDLHDPFKNLIIGILSQNTSDRNSTRAYIGLSKKFKINPKVLAKAQFEKIRDSIRAGGLYNLKAKRIIEFAQNVLDKHDGDLSVITNLPEDRAREALLMFKGIGVKTADVFLVYCMNKDTLPVDTNIERVSKRIGVLDKSAKYDQIQKTLSNEFPSSKRARGHELLIRLGRDFCKASKPLCDKCPVNSICKKIHMQFN